MRVFEFMALVALVSLLSLQGAQADAADVHAEHPARENQASGAIHMVAFPGHLLPLVEDLEVQLHLTYGFNGPVLHARIQGILEVVATWQRSARTPRDEALLEQWLHDAIARSLPGRRASLARVPAFTPSSQAAPPAVHSSEQVAGVQDGAPLPPLPDRLSDVPAAAGGSSDHRRAAHAKTALVPQPAGIATPTRRPIEPPPPSREPLHSAAGVPASQWNGSNATADIPQRAVAEPLTVQPPRVTPPRAPLSTKHASAAPVIPSVAIDAEEEAENDQILMVDQLENELAQVSVQLNLDEYLARLVGHRRGLRRLEAEILQLEAPSVDQLASFVGELESLDHQGSLLTLYAQLLPAKSQAAYGQPASTVDARTVLLNLVTERRADMRERANRTSSPGHEQDLYLLDVLATRLVMIRH